MVVVRNRKPLHLALSFATVLLLVPLAGAAAGSRAGVPWGYAAYVHLAVVESAAEMTAVAPAEAEAGEPAAAEEMDSAIEPAGEAAEAHGEAPLMAASQDVGGADQDPMRYVKALWLLFNLTLVLFLVFIFFLILTIHFRYRIQVKKQKTELEDLWWSPRWGAHTEDDDLE